MNEKKTLETQTPEFLENKQKLKEQLFSDMEKVFDACWDDGNMTAGFFILRLATMLHRIAEEIKTVEVCNINFPKFITQRK